ncbi:hypothetical protein [Glycomyces harbinensis]|uniref:Uncharacterized protein n=1 Tax=Glycomyces harbinensis TaxID=58114 RepID=A0A1G7DE59_9ACTN|nr:hypothetical protein [Glycomyces harbinensis]SDE49791.1 hypothetical protein SAMN05216270_12453 [Glycomyces harbinensis]
MLDDRYNQEASLKYTKRSVTIGAVGILLGVITLFYTVFVDFGGVEWIRSTHGGGTDASHGTSVVEEADPGGSGGAEDDSATGDSKAVGHDWAPSSAFFWPVEQANSIWAALLHIGLIGIYCQAWLTILNIIYMYLAPRSFNYFYCWIAELLLLVPLTTRAAIHLGSDARQDSVLSFLATVIPGSLAMASIVLAAKFDWRTFDGARFGAIGRPRHHRGPALLPGEQRSGS